MMNEDSELILDDTKTRMKKSLADLANSYSQIRSGRASTAMVDDIRVDAYGQSMPMNQVATISIPEARLITIDVWDKSILQSVEKALLKSGRDINPQNDGTLIRIQLPDLTEERRKELVKIAKQKVEDHKISVRNIRRDANDALKKLKSEGISEDDIRTLQDEVQTITDKFIKDLDNMLAQKEKEIMTI